MKEEPYGSVVDVVTIPQRLPLRQSSTSQQNQGLGPLRRNDQQDDYYVLDSMVT
jgi:hypothetical protein